MSLINDALQRAKQQPAPPAPTSNLQLRPAETPQSHNHTGRWLAVTFLGLLIIAGAIVPAIVRGKTAVSVEIRTNAAPQVQSMAQSQAPSAAAPAVEIPAKIETAASPAPTPVDGTSTPATNTIIPPAEVSAPKPAPLKLNGIVFHATKPSAIVNGKTVFQNSRVGEFTVRSITANSVQLVSATATNVLSIDDL